VAIVAGAVNAEAVDMAAGLLASGDARAGNLALAPSHERSSQAVDKSASAHISLVDTLVY
jgi:hypothetical protein